MVNGNISNWYAFPKDSNISVNGIGTFIQYVNNATNGWLAPSFILLIFLATFGLSIGSGSRKALAVSGFISFVFSIYFLRMGMINPVICIVLIILTIIGLIGSKNETNY